MSAIRIQLIEQLMRTGAHTILDKDIPAAKELIIHREKQVKPNRTKLNHPEQYRYERPVHYYMMDYRYGTAKTIITDILNGLEDSHGKTAI